MSNELAESWIEESDENFVASAELRIYRVKDAAGPGARETIKVCISGDHIEVARAMIEQGVSILAERDENSINIAIDGALQAVGR